jgi:starch-binding outer membrane protein, SusD/RagB family
MQLIKYYIVCFIIIISIGFTSSGCKKILEVDAPVFTTNESVVYKSDASAASVLTGIYARISQQAFWSLSVFPSLSADELTVKEGVALPSYNAYYKNALTSDITVQGATDFWILLYPYIFYCNAAIEGLEKSQALTPSVKKQLIGEAKFIRALSYFYLVNLYGDVPLTTSTDYKFNSLIARTPKESVYEQIIHDLTEARDSLSSNFMNATIKGISTERVRPSKWAAAALLARVYLYTNDYVNAEIQSSSVIENSTLFELASLDDAFLKNTKESIWQLEPVNFGRNTEDAFFFVVPEEGLFAPHPVYMSSVLLSKFETGDLRRNKWVGDVTIEGTSYSYPYKYKVFLEYEPVTEYTSVLRISEQYLIRAEARIMQNKISDGITDINKVRARATDQTAPLADRLAEISISLTQPEALEAITHERQVELFTELGHRWLDLKRSANVNNVMTEISSLKGGVWNANSALYPIPLEEMKKNPKLVQNEGYN